MADYTTLSAIKTYLHITGTAHDTLLTELITRASRLIDDHCGRAFSTTTATRYYDAVGPHISGRLLLLESDLYSLTSITNGDGVVINPTDVVLRPINLPPYYGIAIKQSSGLRWNYLSDPDGAIAINGAWGYSATAPEPIVHATLRLASWLYRQRDMGTEIAQLVTTDRGVAVAPARLPRDVLDMIGAYTRLRIKIL